MNQLLKISQLKTNLMIQKFLLLKSYPFLAMLLGFTFLEVLYLPSVDFILLLSIAVIIDLITGLCKAWVQKNNTTSQGLRQTISKLTQYAGFILVGTILLNISVGKNNFSKYRVIIDGAFIFILLIELISICENLIAINPEAKIVKYVVTPFMKLIKGKVGIK